jgi:TonB family protein
MCLLISGLAWAQSTDSKKPKILSAPALEYPLGSRRYDEEGTTAIRLEVSTTGAVHFATIQTSSGYPRLDAAALKYAHDLVMEPALSLDGKPVEKTLTLPINFHLDPPIPPRDPAVRSVIGIYIAPLNEESARAFSLPRTSLTITTIRAGGPAEQSGLQVGDIILKVNDWPTTTPNDFFYTVTQTRPGKHVMLEYFRKDNVRKAVVPVESIPR